MKIHVCVVVHVDLDLPYCVGVGSHTQQDAAGRSMKKIK